MIATDECPKILLTTCNGTPAPSIEVAAECLNVWMPTSSSPAEYAAAAEAAIQGSLANPDHDPQMTPEQHEFAASYARHLFG